MPRLHHPPTGLLLLALVVSFVSVAHGEATDATKSIATGDGLQYATSGTAASFTVTALDGSAVRRTSGGDNFLVELEGTRSMTGSVVDNLDGTYAVSYTATKSGTYEASVKLAKSGGLSAAYYENVWFFYTPVKTTVDPQINMDWGTGLLTPTGADYISVRWQGKIKPQFAETYTFYATTDDGAKLWVDNVPLVDRWDSFCNETSATISLHANVFYNIDGVQGGCLDCVRAAQLGQPEHAEGDHSERAALLRDSHQAEPVQLHRPAVRRLRRRVHRRGAGTGHCYCGHRRTAHCAVQRRVRQRARHR
jgi:hypothetical protein